MTTLYELSGQYLALSELADDPDMPENALSDSLEALEGDIEVKAQALLQVVASLDGDTGAIDAEIKRLQARKKTIDNRTQRLREYLRHNMEVTGISNIRCPLFQISLAKGREVVVVDNEALIPDSYMKTTKAPLKADILKALKSGKDVPGCALGRGQTSLRIK